MADESKTAPTLKLTYFGFEGAGEQVRLALHLAGLKFEDNRIAREEWMKLKGSTPFGQMPLLEVDGTVHAQSQALIRYVARISDSDTLYPSDPAGALKVDQVLGVLDDLYRAWYPKLLFNPPAYGHPEDASAESVGDFKKRAREHFVANDLPKFLTYLSNLLKANAPEGGEAFLCGEHPTIADCRAAPMLKRYTMGYIDHVPTTCLDGCAPVKAWLARFYALPKVKAYYDDLAAKKAAAASS